MIVGIDLGTSTSEIAFFRNDRPVRVKEIAYAPHGFLPSVVGFQPDGRLCLGSPAEQLQVLHPDRAVAEAKRLMGTDARISLAGSTFTPQEIAAILLKHLKMEAERHLGEAVTEAVITVPAYFTNAQRQATRDAGELAGLTVRRLVNEPTAAALAYGLERPQVEEKILVYDLGGGTLDVTVLDLSEGVLDVLASTGNTKLGGKDFDEALMARLRELCLRETGLDLTSTRKLEERLRRVARRAKEELSAAERSIVALENLALRPDGTEVSFSYTLTRAEFESLIEHLVVSTSRQLDEALQSKGLSSRDIGTVLLIGGSTRIPSVRKFVSAYFGGRPVRTDIDPDEAVSLGAAILAGMESRTIDPDRLVVTDVSSHTLGVAIMCAPEGGDPMPGCFDPLILKQSTIPRSARKTYSTVADNQKSVHVEVYQGDSERCADNEAVGDFVLEGLPNAPAGSPIEVEFCYNLSGELEVVARASQWGLEKRVWMRPSRRHLSADEKSTARTRLERLWNTSVVAEPVKAETGKPSTPRAAWRTSRHYSRVAALMTHAERRLPTLSDESAAQVASLIRAMRSALERDDEVSLDESERSLTDLLFSLS